MNMQKKFVDVEAIRKEILPYVVDNQLTYKDFDKIFGFLPHLEQYHITDALADILNIELVDEIILPPAESITEKNTPLIFRRKEEITASNEILIGLIKHGDRQARQDLCVKNRGLVEKIAARYEKYLSSQLTLEDLVHEGIIGMLKAAEKFDFSQNTKFSTYATWWITQAITRAIADTGLTVRLPAHVVEKILRASRHEKNFMIQGFNLRRRIELIAQEMQMTPEDVSNLFALRAAYMNIISLDKPVDEEDGDSILIDFIENKNALDPVEGVRVILLKENLEKALNTLTPREKDVLKLRYGLEDGKAHTLDDIGKSFHVTRERIRQIENKALHKLRHLSQSKKLRDFLD